MTKCDLCQECKVGLTCKNQSISQRPSPSQPWQWHWMFRSAVCRVGSRPLGGRVGAGGWLWEGTKMTDMSLEEGWENNGRMSFCTPPPTPSSQCCLWWNACASAYSVVTACMLVSYCICLWCEHMCGRCVGQNMFTVYDNVHMCVHMCGMLCFSGTAVLWAHLSHF